jgi:ribosomal protein S18 acetylase RimI-like enzyme
MPGTEKQGLLKKASLSEVDIAEIAQLIALCNEHDSLHMRIPLEELAHRSGNEIDDFLYYEQGQLVGYLYVDSWGKEEKEITGMVAPAFRRQGIFRQLFESTQEEFKPRKVETLILVSEESSHAGHAFAKAVKAHHDFSEHQMVLGNFVERKQSAPQFEIRPATLQDKEAIISILTIDVGDTDDTRQFVEEFYADPTIKLYLATLAGKTLGTLRLYYRDEAVSIYGFVVRPEYRGKGYGRQMLEYTIHQIHDEGLHTIMLEVDTTNHNALGLYKSCGFQIKTTYDYFNRPL